MQPEPAYKQKIEKYVTKIRRDARNKAVQKMRNKMYFEAEPIEIVAEGFRLPPKQQGQYTIIEILSKCYRQLINVHTKITKMTEQTNRYNNNQIDIKAHFNFWAFLLQEFFTNKLGLNEELEEFFVQFVKKNSYKVISYEKFLQTKVLNALQVAMVSEKASIGMKKIILKWVTGTDGLILINNCLFNEFLTPSEYQNVYEVLKQAMKLQNIEKLDECCTIIKHIMKTADFDDTFSIYTDQNELMVDLLVEIQRIVQEQNVESFADAIIYLMDSYNSMIFDYARMGVALLATRMIISRRQPNIMKGLQIIKFLSEVDEKNAATFLIEDRQLNEAGLWTTLVGSDMILFNQNVSIKREGYTILANMMSQGHYDLMLALNKKVDCLDLKQLFDISAFAIKNEQDPIVLRNALIMLSVLIYYSYNYRQQKGYNQILEKIYSNTLQNDLNRLQGHKNEQISKSALKILDDIIAISEPDRQLI